MIQNIIFDAKYDGAKEATMKNLSVYGTLTTKYALKTEITEIKFYIFYQTKKGTKIQLRLFPFRKCIKTKGCLLLQKKGLGQNLII